MSKTIKSILCPQCNASEAIQLSDGTYKCKYCGTHFWIDDNSTTHTINVNINVNVNHHNEQPSYNVTPNYRPHNGNYPSWMDKKTRLFIIGLPLFFGMVCFLMSLCSKGSQIIAKTDPKHQGTLSQNLPKGYEVYEINPTEVNGKPVFIAETKYWLDDDKREIKLIDADSLTITDIECPDNIKIKDTDIIYDMEYGKLILGKNKTIYRFDWQTLTFKNLTDSIFGLSDILSPSTVLKISINRDIEGLEFVTSDGKKYYYDSHINQIISNPSSKQQAKENTKAVVVTDYAMCGTDKHTDQDLYAIKINNKGESTQRKWKGKVTLYKSLKLTPKQLNPDIISITCIKKLGLSQASIIYSDNEHLFIDYNLNGIEFLRKTDLKGEEIWTKRMTQHYKPSEAYMSGITGSTNNSFGGGILLYNNDRRNNTYRYLYIDRNDNIHYIRLNGNKR